MRPDLPNGERGRLEELRAYGVLDTTPEAEYDDLTLLAAEIGDCPIALITLVDESRQWFKSRVGLDVTETPRDQGVLRARDSRAHGTARRPGCHSRQSLRGQPARSLRPVDPLLRRGSPDHPGRQRARHALHHRPGSP